MGARRLVYLARDARRRQRHVTALESRGFDVVEGRPADGKAIVEQCRPDGTIVDTPNVQEDDVELIAWLRRTPPWQDLPCFVSNVPPGIREDLAEALPGLRLVKGRIAEAVADAFDDDGIEVAEARPERMDDVLVV